jgi:hypothetical protein
MDYVDWVHKVMRGIVTVWSEADYDKKLIGLEIHDIVPGLGLEADSRSGDFRGSKIDEAIHDALRDLELVSWLDAEDGMFYKVTQMGSAFPDGDVTTAWQVIVDIRLDDEEIGFLEALAGIGEENYETHACVKNLSWQEVFEELGWSTEDDSRADYITKRLEGEGMIRRRAAMGRRIDVIPTYVGIVRATRQAETEWGRTIRQLVKEWETTTVEFKRELNLKRSREKAKFVSRVMGLATTRSSGRRFFVVGFDNDTHEFVRSVDPKITQEQLEQILHAYCQPPMHIRYTRAAYLSGEVGIVEVFRNPEDIPYRVAKEIRREGGIKVGDVYVRHGSRTEPPSEAELHDLIEEGEAARQRVTGSV